MHEAAESYVAGHPVFARRIGSVAVERIESVLFGLAVLGQAPADDLGLLLPRMHPVGHGLRFRNPIRGAYQGTGRRARAPVPDALHTSH